MEIGDYYIFDDGEMWELVEYINPPNNEGHDIWVRYVGDPVDKLYSDKISPLLEEVRILTEEEKLQVLLER